MSKSIYIEDVFSEFFSEVITGNLEIQRQDYSASSSFHNVISSGSLLTKNQAGYIIKILQKYKNLSKMVGLDYELTLKNPQWKNNFRVLDMSKKIYVEQDENNELWIMVKFPFALKELFEKEISSKNQDYAASVWDPQNKVRKLKFYNFNIVEIYEFVQKHNFEIEESFLSAMAGVEEIWENSEKIIPYSDVVDGQVQLFNASESAEKYFQDHRSGKVNNDLFLAKCLAINYKNTPSTVIEKIAAAKEQTFHIKNNSTVFDIYKEIDGPIAVIVGGSDDSIRWVKNFTSDAVKNNVDPREIRVCFREDKTSNKGFNQWVKDNGFGGKVEGAKIYIFQNKPPKWLFSENIDVKIIVTNSLYPVPNAVSQTWMENHPCVCFVGDIKASQPRERKIVEL